MPSRRSGLTLIEILVVIAIIGLLMAILVPAVQYVRESARKQTCQNHLKQQALAIHNFESSHGEMPKLFNGTFLKKPEHHLHEFHFHSWRTAILPELDQAPLHARIDFALPATDPSNQANLNTTLAVFLCPSVSNPTENVPDLMAYPGDTIPPLPEELSTAGSAAPSDYEVVGGVFVPPAPPEPRHTGSLDLRGLRFGVWGDWDYAIKKGGIMSGIDTAYRTGRLRDVTDGLSHTLMLVERAGGPDYYRNGELFYEYPSPPDAHEGVEIHQVAWGVSTHTWWLVHSDSQAINERNSIGIYSFHTSGAYVAFADGSVRFLSESMDQDTLNTLITRSGGEPVSLE